MGTTGVRAAAGTARSEGAGGAGSGLQGARQIRQGAIVAVPSQPAPRRSRLEAGALPDSARRRARPCPERGARCAEAGRVRRSGAPAAPAATVPRASTGALGPCRTSTASPRPVLSHKAHTRTAAGRLRRVRRPCGCLRAARVESLTRRHAAGSDGVVRTGAPSAQPHCTHSRQAGASWGRGTRPRPPKYHYRYR